MGDDGSVRDIVALISDDYAWAILEATREEAKSADVLSEVCDADPSTVYRRIERLEEADLLVAQQQLNPDGNHYKTYRARLAAVRLTLGEEGFDVDVERTESPADKFTRLYEGFK